MPDGTEVTQGQNESTVNQATQSESSANSVSMYSWGLKGRRVIYTDETEINEDNICDVLNDAMVTHRINSSEIDYLRNYYKGEQPILLRQKDVRPEINNKVVENHALETITFKVGYVFGEPVQYVSKSNDPEKPVEDTAEVGMLNDFMFSASKHPNDHDIGENQAIAGTAYRLALPLKPDHKKDAPFEISSLDPERTFVVYANNYKKTPLLGVTYTENIKSGLPAGKIIFDCYTENKYFKIDGGTGAILMQESIVLGMVPIIEYPANNARLGAFEPVLSMLDAINTTRSNQVDGVEQFVQAFIKFVNADITLEDFQALRREGAIKVKSVEGQQADVDIVSEELSQTETEVLIQSMYQTILTICGVPNRNSSSSVPDTGTASIVGNGWTIAETQAKDLEIMFKKSEQQFLKLILRILRVKSKIDLALSDIDIKFTRRNYEAVQSKAQTLTTMLGCEKIAPLLAFQACGLFPDIESAYRMSLKYIEKAEKAKEPPPDSGPKPEPQIDPTAKGVEDKIGNNAA